MENIGGMEDIKNLFKETIAEFMEASLEAELDEELGYSRYDYKIRIRTTVATGTAASRCALALGMLRFLSPGIASENLSPVC